MLRRLSKQCIAPLSFQPSSITHATFRPLFRSMNSFETTSTTPLKDETIDIMIDDFTQKGQSILSKSKTNATHFLRFLSTNISQIEENEEKGDTVQKLQITAIRMLLHNKFKLVAMHLGEEMRDMHSTTLLRDGYGIIISAMFDNKQYLKIIHMYEEILRNERMNPTSAMATHLLRSMNFLGEYRKSLQVFTSFDTDGNTPMNKHTYRAALVACCHLGEFEKAKSLVDDLEMKGWDVEFKDLQYVSGAAITANEYEAAWSYQETILEMKLMSPDNAYIYTKLMMNALEKKDWKRLVNEYDHVRDDGIVVLSNEAITACLTAFIELDDWEKAVLEYFSMKNQGYPGNSNILRQLYALSLEHQNAECMGRALQEHVWASTSFTDSEVRSQIKLLSTLEDCEEQMMWLVETGPSWYSTQMIELVLADETFPQSIKERISVHDTMLSPTVRFESALNLKHHEVFIRTILSCDDMEEVLGDGKWKSAETMEKVLTFCLTQRATPNEDEITLVLWKLFDAHLTVHGKEESEFLLEAMMLKIMHAPVPVSTQVMLLDWARANELQILPEFIESWMIKPMANDQYLVIIAVYKLGEATGWDHSFKAVRSTFHAYHNTGHWEDALEIFAKVLLPMHEDQFTLSNYLKRSILLCHRKLGREFTMQKLERQILTAKYEKMK